ncbi:ABC transporter permease [Paracoccus aminophilus]|uniref:Spermidine/putrescine transport system, permease protein n=1 Tax=Paracoccus aminophilus JCM 7686 TaxID=1367847 RepID=S5XUH3_PARAH|nr:ABC transporter permease [Paracoccus aminophilus]AGT08862.1 spermidine/putrescine transport system, permease protein [Paracoccus aminophilus JCM 7686]
MRALQLCFTLLVSLFLLVPLLIVLPLAFTSGAFLAYPIPDLSLRWFDELVTSEIWRRALVNSLVIGAATAALATLLGTTAALGLRRSGAVSARVIGTVFLLPLVVPAVVLGVGLQRLLAELGLSGSYLAVIIAHTVVAVPFVMISVSGALASVPAQAERAAASLGASPLTVLREVTLPLSRHGILTGAALAFATSLDEVVLTMFVAGPRQRTLSRQMFSSLRENISPTIAAAAFVFILLTLALGGLVLLARRSRSLPAAER